MKELIKLQRELEEKMKQLIAEGKVDEAMVFMAELEQLMLK